MQSKHTKWIIGIDEAGRGPLAGPVVVGGIKLRDRRRGVKILRGVRDSKKLTAKKREEWFGVLTSCPQIKWAAAKVWPKTIDRINIAGATNLGVKRIYKKLVCSRPSLARARLGLEQTYALLDGGLKLPLHVPHEIIIRGDEKIPVIAAASIIAKVTRDSLMRRLHKKYPQYGFDIHKGYCTKVHREQLRANGLSDVHRKSFCGKFL